MTGILDMINLRGDVHFQLYDQNGDLKMEREDKNMVVTAGLGHVTSRLIGTAQAVMGWMEVGTDATAAATAQTTLVAAVGGSRTALTGSAGTQQTTTLTNDTVQFVCTFGAGVGTGALVEAGVFNASSAGTMMCRTVFSVINKGALDSLTITWKVKFA
jgi:hypothetical protein